MTMARAVSISCLVKTDALDPVLLRRARKVLWPLYRYHRFEILGLENVPRTGAALLVVHHSLATYDGFMLGDAIYAGTGRLPRGLGDDRIFQIPGLRELALAIGIVPASPEAGERLLAEGHILGVAPGGMWESLRPREERRRSRWEGRRGFVRLALRASVPMIFGACPAADEIFTVYPSRLTDAVYARAHWPVPLVRGIGPTLLPRPVKIRAFLSEPLVPPAWDPAQEDAQIDLLHAQATERMGALLRRS